MRVNPGILKGLFNVIKILLFYFNSVFKSLSTYMYNVVPLLGQKIFL